MKIRTQAGEITIVKVTGEPIVRICGRDTRQAIKRAIHLIDALAQDPQWAGHNHEQNQEAKAGPR